MAINVTIHDARDIADVIEQLIDDKVSPIQKELDDAETDISDLESDLDTAKDRVRDLEEEISELQKRIEELENELSELHAERAENA